MTAVDGHLGRDLLEFICRRHLQSVDDAPGKDALAGAAGFATEEQQVDQAVLERRAGLLEGPGSEDRVDPVNQGREDRSETVPSRPTKQHKKEGKASVES